MAEYCPKCNYKFKKTDWRPECPQCGVNVLYYGIEDRLRAEADKAELEHAHMQPRFDRLKFSLIGHPLAIVRLVLGLLPIAATLIPSGQISYVLPFGTQTKDVNLIGVINFLTGADLDTGLLSKLWGSALVGKGLVFFSVALLSLLLMLVVTLVGFFLLTLSCSPKGFRRNIAFPVTGTLVKRTAISQVTRTLGTLLSSGVPILQALVIVRDTTGNQVVRNALQSVHDAVKEGESMTDPLAASGVFPPTFRRMYGTCRRRAVSRQRLSSSNAASGFAAMSLTRSRQEMHRS